MNGGAHGIGFWRDALRRVQVRAGPVLFSATTERGPPVWPRRSVALQAGWENPILRPRFEERVLVSHTGRARAGLGLLVVPA